MQKLAIHLQHYKRQQVAKLGAEGQRLITSTLDNRIDFSQSKYNFQASTGERMQRKSYTQELIKICSAYGMKQKKVGKRIMLEYENGKTIRRDANVMTGIVVTLDRETVEAWGIEKSKAYFKECSNYLRGLFGNCIDDVVHTDETGAGWHLHFYACPILKGSFNSKQLWNRQALLKLHTDLAKHLQSKGFAVARGESNTGIDYKESYKDYKRSLAPVIHNADKIEQAITTIKEGAIYHAESKGFLGVGAKDASIEIPVGHYKALLRLAEQGKGATIELAENRKRIDQSRKLQQAEQEKAALWSDAEGYKAENEKLKQELKALPAHVVKAYEEKNRGIIETGLFIKRALQDTDFAYSFGILLKAYRAKQAEQAKQRLRDRQKPLRDRTRAHRGRDDLERE